VTLQGERPALGLRERKKAKTRATIQKHALRLFREQGYEATTVSQIAEAAEVSESTLFRYFPTKEDIVRWDEFDPLIVEAFKAQPAGVSPIAALRGAFRDVLGQLPAAERAELRERIALALSIPPLRTMGDDPFSGPMRLLAEAIAERAGRRPDDLAVRTLVGAAMGAFLAVAPTVVEDPQVDIVLLIDKVMAQLEAGLPL
jgi:AcrR family transcriptional regulator